jgi:hypothetical protein
MTRSAVRVALAVLAVFVAAQLIPEPRTNPPVSREIRWDAPETRALTQRACFDCHTNHTVWPWYSRVAPTSFLVVSHVNDGRARLNFSEWDHANASFDDVDRMVTSGRMPIWNYVLIHPAAKLTPAETQRLLAGLRATFRQDPPIPRRGLSREP